ncbi:hypothetical protein BDZ89DRAFT_1155962 [Hymenopellis radicata]|nr:hypothetical protein BDZ89DRAFT_1155962 [Hymenopellis radicata]
MHDVRAAPLRFGPSRRQRRRRAPHPSPIQPSSFQRLVLPRFLTDFCGSWTAGLYWNHRGQSRYRSPFAPSAPPSRSPPVPHPILPPITRAPSFLNGFSSALDDCPFLLQERAVPQLFTLPASPHPFSRVDDDGTGLAPNNGTDTNNDDAGGGGWDVSTAAFTRLPLSSNASSVRSGSATCAVTPRRPTSLAKMNLGQVLASKLSDSPPWLQPHRAVVAVSLRRRCGLTEPSSWSHGAVVVPLSPCRRRPTAP